MIDFIQLEKISKTYGDSFYLFDANVFEENVRAFTNSFIKRYPKVEVAYSYKTNYMPSILKRLDRLGVSAEVVSEMEYDLASAMGVKLNKIIFNGPVKGYSSLVKAINNQSRINIDSLDELELILEILPTTSLKNLEIGIRCNFGVRNGAVSRFGLEVSAEEFTNALAMIESTPAIRLSGLHCHLPERDLDSVTWRTQKLLEISLKTFKEPPNFLDFGGGFFGSDFAVPLQNAISFDEYAETITGLVKTAYPDSSSQPLIILEPGTALVANTMSYWTKVVSTKKVERKSIAVVDGSIHEMNPNGRKHRNPTFHESSLGSLRTATDSWHVVGYTCIEDDYLSKDYVSNISKGDFLGYSHSGSYNIVMKPSFIRPASAVLEIGENAEVLNVIREKQTISDVFSGFQYWV